MKGLLKRFEATAIRSNKAAKTVTTGWRRVRRFFGTTTQLQLPLIFRSARLKLTAFYLATLLVFSLTLTGGIRLFAEYEMNQAYIAQRGEFRELARNGLDLLVANPEKIFRKAQDYHANIARQNLNHDLVLLNIGVLILGGLLSYWFAGRTLKPIAKAHEAQARFVADASHELRTPLANIRAENEVFLRQKDFDKHETRELIQSNLEEVQRLEHLSRDLLALAQYGQATLLKGVVPVEAIVREAVAHTKKVMEERSVRVERRLEPAGIYGNQESLVRLFVILLDNAVKYGPEAGTIYVAGAKHGAQYVITVRDEGRGIASKDLPHIFDRLYRGDQSRTATTSGYGAPGYGLGLALAAEIVQVNQGSIKAYNAPQGGAVFSVQLPIAR